MIITPLYNVFKNFDANCIIMNILVEVYDSSTIMNMLLTAHNMHIMIMSPVRTGAAQSYWYKCVILEANYYTNYIFLYFVFLDNQTRCTGYISTACQTFLNKHQLRIIVSCWCLCLKVIRLTIKL